MQPDGAVQKEFYRKAIFKPETSLIKGTFTGVLLRTLH